MPGFADLVTVDLFDEVLRGEEPPSASVFTPGETIALSRAAQRSAKEGTDRAPGPATPVSHTPGSVAARCMATGRSTVELAAEPGQGGEWAFGPGLAADPAHWPAGNPLIEGAIAADGLTGRITVPLRARGALLAVVAFSRLDRPEAFTADDLILAEEMTAKAAVAIDNARRYSRERTTALTLQRSPLVQGAPAGEPEALRPGREPQATRPARWPPSPDPRAAHDRQPRQRTRHTGIPGRPNPEQPPDVDRRRRRRAVPGRRGRAQDRPV
ncbi:hypothetical protein [Streptomyces sp. NPDC003943]